MTKLTEWIIIAGVALSLWITPLADILPLKVSYKAKEVIWPVITGTFYERVSGFHSMNQDLLNCGKQRTYFSHIYFCLSFADANLCSNCIWGELICYALLIEFIFVRSLC